VPPPSTPRMRSPGFTIVIVGQAHRVPRVSLSFWQEKQAMRLLYKCCYVILSGVKDLTCSQWLHASKLV
jgi:hypothetical protein